MELWPVTAKKYPTKVSLELRETLLEFTLHCLLEQPKRINIFAKEYFEHLTEETEIEYDLSIEDQMEECQVDQGDDMPQDYTPTRGQVVYSEPYNPEKDLTSSDSDNVYEKSSDQRILLRQMIDNSILFRALDNVQINKVIDVMYPVEVDEGDLVIKQYDDGDKLYVIEHGLFDVFIAPEPDVEPNHIFTYDNAGTFGELALMYNMPRAATIRAKTPGRLWAMDRNTFRKLVLKAAFRKRKMYEELISRVDMLSNITPYEKMTLADALLPRFYEAGTIVIQQGETADGMYFVEKGEVSCSVYDEELNEHIEVAILKEGSYFGELALITQKPRAATVVAVEDTKLAFLDVETFERILGPCIEIMTRNIEAYGHNLRKAKAEKSRSNSPRTSAA